MRISWEGEDVNIRNCQMKSKGVTTQMKTLNEYTLMVLFVLLLESSFSCKWNLKVWQLKWKLSMSTF